MKNLNPIIEELKVLRDEVSLQAHLFSMEAKDEFEELEIKFNKMKNEFENSVQQFGEANEEFWLGYKQNLDSLKEEYQNLKKSNIEGH